MTQNFLDTKIVQIMRQLKNIQKQRKNNISNLSFSDYLTYIISNSVDSIKSLFQQLNYVPYKVQRDGTVKKDESEYVRNIATLHDLLRFNIKDDDTLYQFILDNLKTLQSSVNVSISPSHEKFIGYSALAFYLLCLLHLRDKEKLEYEELVNNIKNFLFENLEKITDTEFELPECLIALCYCFPTEEEKTILYEKLYKLLKESQQKPNLRKGIFQKNWIAKYMYTLYQTTGLPSGFNMIYVTNLKKQMIDFCKKFQNQDLETNKIAVCFEGLSSLLYLTPHDTETFYSVLELLKQLNKRRKDDFLFYFLNETARIDITGHVLNGYYVLLQIEKRKME